MLPSVRIGLLVARKASLMVRVRMMGLLISIFLLLERLIV